MTRAPGLTASASSRPAIGLVAIPAICIPAAVAAGAVSSGFPRAW